MKTNLKITLIILLSMFISGCSQDNLQEQIPEAIDHSFSKTKVKKKKKIPDLITPEFSKAKLEVQETFGAIAQSIIDGDMDKLISFHAYGSKFTEFKNGEPRNGGDANETYERNVFGSISEVLKFEANDLQIAVYGEVANLTFHSDFHLKFGDNIEIVHDQITLLFVKSKKGWKMVHEHHSPLNELLVID